MGQETLEGGEGRDQISQDGVFRPSHPRSVNNDCVTAELTYSAAHAGHGHCVRWAPWAPPKKAAALLLSPGRVPWVSRERRGYSVSTATAAVPARRA